MQFILGVLGSGPTRSGPARSVTAIESTNASAVAEALMWVLLPHTAGEPLPCGGSPCRVGEPPYDHPARA